LAIFAVGVKDGCFLCLSHQKFNMLLLFETPAGYALFKVLDEGKIKNVDNIYKYFETADAAQGLCVSIELKNNFATVTQLICLLSFRLLQCEAGCLFKV
jgi:hypothetical protein